jgi:hypothetical protein
MWGVHADDNDEIYVLRRLKKVNRPAAAVVPTAAAAAAAVAAQKGELTFGNGRGEAGWWARCSMVGWGGMQCTKRTRDQGPGTR